MALGSSAVEAAERARLLAIRAGEHCDAPSMLTVRLEEPGRSVYILQPAYLPVSPDTFGEGERSGISADHG